MRRACALAAVALGAVALGVLACGSSQPPPVDLHAVAYADCGSHPNQFIGSPLGAPVQAIPVVGSEARFTLSSPGTVLVLANITFSIASGKGYVYPNLEIDGRDGGRAGPGHHFSTTDSDSGDSTPSVSAGWSRVETVAAGRHTARLTMDADPETSAWVFCSQVRVLRLSS